MQTKISVVIPTYNRPKLLTRCLKALIQQSLDKKWFEVIVVSDGPDQETARILQPWLRDRRLNLLFLSTEVKKGPAASRNLGWLSAKSPVIAFTDDDCIPAKDWLLSFLLYDNGAPLQAWSGRTSVPLPEKPTDFARNTAGLESAEFITANCACTKRALLLTGGFDERFRLAWREDSDLHFKLLETGISIVKVQEALVIHPVRDAAWGISLKEQKKAAYEALLFRKFPNLYRARIGVASIWNYYIINLMWLILLLSIIAEHSNLAKVAALVQTVLLLSFAYRRLRGCSKSFMHVMEMLSTSTLIPTLSVYWRIYGAVKYRVLFI
jgi:glycosyltransferase involved in cell wall biosynthesis